MKDALSQGFSAREAYAECRRREFFAACRAGAISPREMIQLDCADQEASLHLAELAHRIAQLIDRLDVDTVLVHAYEGGHPDHDATAFAVHAAAQMCSSRAARLIEFTSYHDRDGQFEAGVFLPREESPEVVFRLGAEEVDRKERMFACYRTQQDVLRQFGIREERFRLAPAYNFTKPPHAGPAYYDRFPWGMTTSRWVELARAARRQLGLC
jgi:N-acetylglucosamine malate deacetylase 2